ncbi:MAG TPA: CPXCG motif-containing cysteine-rich protein [Gemmatimonadales bacterium]|jgi:hypothetical protein|nr:CPXCG motif-containing cysteine-rich protein [Gemmatimonadales bacterium]
MVAFSDDDPDDEFPVGDGTVDTRAVVVCPYCGEANDIVLDAGGGEFQEYVEDCQVCCRPWRLTVIYDEAGAARVAVAPLDD